MTFKIKNPLSRRAKHGIYSDVYISDQDISLVENWRLHITSAGYVRGRHIDAATGKREFILLHRRILDLKNDDTRKVDHINLNQLDCRRENLRIVTMSINSQNTATYSNSGYKGVHRIKEGYGFVAQATFAHKNHYLGFFGDAEQAARAYDGFARKMYPNPRLNFPQNDELPARLSVPK